MCMCTYILLVFDSLSVKVLSFRNVKTISLHIIIKVPPVMPGLINTAGNIPKYSLIGVL